MSLHHRHLDPLTHEVLERLPQEVPSRSLVPADPAKPTKPSSNLFERIPGEIIQAILKLLPLQDCHNASAAFLVILVNSPFLLYLVSWPRSETPNDQDRTELEAQHRQRVLDLLADREHGKYIRQLALTSRDIGALAKAGLRIGTRFKVVPDQYALEQAKVPNWRREIMELHIERLFDRLAANTPNLRSFSSTIVMGRASVKSLRSLPRLTELALPASDGLQALRNWQGLARLTVYNVQPDSRRPGPTPSLPALLDLSHLTLTILGTRDAPGNSTAQRVVCLNDHPNLLELWLVGAKGRPAHHIITGDSQSIQRLVLDGPFEFDDEDSFCTFVTQCGGLTLHSLSCRNLKLLYPDSSVFLPHVSNLKAVEFINCNPSALAGFKLTLKKALLWPNQHMPAAKLFNLLRRSLEEGILEVLSVCNPDPVPGFRKDCHSFSRRFVNRLLLNTKLQFFESLGNYHFNPEDAKLLHLLRFPALQDCNIGSSLTAFNARSDSYTPLLLEGLNSHSRHRRFLALADPKADFQLSHGQVMTKLVPCVGANEVRACGELVPAPTLKRKRPAGDTATVMRHYEAISDDSEGPATQTTLLVPPTHKAWDLYKFL